MRFQHVNVTLPVHVERLFQSSPIFFYIIIFFQNKAYIDYNEEVESNERQTIQRVNSKVINVMVRNGKDQVKKWDASRS